MYSRRTKNIGDLRNRFMKLSDYNKSNIEPYKFEMVLNSLAKAKLKELKKDNNEVFLKKAIDLCIIN